MFLNKKTFIKKPKFFKLIYGSLRGKIVNARFRELKKKSNFFFRKRQFKKLLSYSIFKLERSFNFFLKFLLK